MDGENAFVWSVAPFFTRQLANSGVKNGTRIFDFFSFVTVSGRGTLTGKKVGISS